MNFSSVNALTSADWTHHFQRMERLHAGLAIPSIAADGGVEAESVVISAFLTSIRNVHQGAFSWRKGKNTGSALRRTVEDLILNSPGLCATCGLRGTLASAGGHRPARLAVGRATTGARADPMPRRYP